MLQRIGDNFDSWIGKGGFRKLRIFDWHMDESWVEVTNLAKAALKGPQIGVAQFLGCCVRGGEHLSRARGLADQGMQDDFRNYYDDEDIDPIAGPYFQFPRAILMAVEYARLRVFPSADMDPLVVRPEPDPRFRKWRDLTVKRLREHTLSA